MVSEIGSSVDLGSDRRPFMKFEIDGLSPFPAGFAPCELR
jgi:hypothetical protein